jgi:hypothetical protein
LKKALTFLVAAGILFGSGYYTNAMTHRSVTIQQNRPIVPQVYQTCIHTYLGDLSNGKDITNLLSGEAKQNYLQQKANGKPFQFQVVEMKSLYEDHQQLAVVAVKLNYQVGADSKFDEEYFTLYQNSKKVWKIAQVSREFPSWAHDSLAKGNDTVQSKAVLDSYFRCITEARWKDALNLTGGEVRKQGEETMSFLPKNLKSMMKDMQYTKIASNDKMELVEASYEVRNGITPSQKLTKLFILEKANDSWVITNDLLLQSEEVAGG